MLEGHLVPYLNNIFSNHSEISFDSSIDNMIIKINNTNHYYSLPFNEHYVLFFVVFLKIFSKGYLHFHILNFTLIFNGTISLLLHFI